jgi:hypothetical protein
VLPGAYINFVSKERASANISDRGYAAVPMELAWGKEDEVIELTSEDFITNSLKILGFAYDADELKPIRELFTAATVAYLYRLNSGGTKATNDYATAVCGGKRGNDITIVIEDVSGEGEKEYLVTTKLDGESVDEQTVTSAAQLTDNDFVTFKKDAVLAETAGAPLTGGTDGTSSATTHQKALNALESYSFNTLCCASDDDTIKKLYVAYTKRMRDELGVKFQSVVYNYSADYEGVINVKNKVADSDDFALVYWVTGASAGCAVNASLMNTIYDGEYDINTDYTQSELTQLIQNGGFVFHKTGSDIRVLKDINSFVSTTKDKNEDFTLNQVIRVLDQIANDVAVLFSTQYSGKVPNDKAGRYSLWGDIAKYCEDLQTIRAIEDFSDENLTITKGEGKTAVVVDLTTTPVCAMEKLYMTVYVN